MIVTDNILTCDVLKNEYDYVIIGAGISGLYTALLLEKKYKNPSIIILESEKEIGGRAKMHDFHGKPVVQGAGVGRTKKDKLLFALWESVIFPEPPEYFTPDITYLDFKPMTNITEILGFLKKQKLECRHQETFKSFFLRFFPEQEYKRFIWTNGFSDFEEADVIDTIEDYGFEDNHPNASFFRVDWDRITSYLVHQLQCTDIFLHHRVLSVTKRKKDGSFLLVKGKNWEIKGKKVIWAGHMNGGYRTLGKKTEEIFGQIGYNVFLRYYIYLSKPIPQKYRKKTIYVKTSFQKTTIINDHIILLSYSDNNNAKKTYQLLKEKKIEQEKKRKLFSFSQSSSQKQEKKEDTISFYWKHGTHFYRPLLQTWSNRQEFIIDAQMPYDGCFLVGEIISRNQGWTEGALESIHKIITYL